MGIIAGFFYIFIGVFFVWMGAFQLIAGMLPHDVAMKMAVDHGKWTREHVFKLEPIDGN